MQLRVNSDATTAPHGQHLRGCQRKLTRDTCRASACKALGMGSPGAVIELEVPLAGVYTLGGIGNRSLGGLVRAAPH